MKYEKDFLRIKGDMDGLYKWWRRFRIMAKIYTWVLAIPLLVLGAIFFIYDYLWDGIIALIAASLATLYGNAFMLYSKIYKLAALYKKLEEEVKRR